MSVIALLNAVLGLLQSFVAWGQAKKIFKENEAIIVATILGNALKEIERVKESNARLDAEFRNDPTSVMRDDGFSRD